ncbi:MAG TPA: hypothetical protein VHR84_18965 [Terriglobales bacterium]|jgi:hypothetical protein|nr:hypothetical protein [Terriglobales bacterium]
MRFLREIPLFLATAVFATAAQASPQNPPANLTSVAFQHFAKKLGEYQKLRKKIAGSAPTNVKSAAPETVKGTQVLLAQKIKSARSGAKQGEFFDPVIAQEFRKVLAATVEGEEGGKILASLHDAQKESPPHLGVNQSFPQGAAVPTTPPSLLLNLPPLPKELEYRIIGRQLVLRDADANLIIDYLPNALPAAKVGR